MLGWKRFCSPRDCRRLVWHGRARPRFALPAYQGRRRPISPTWRKVDDGTVPLDRIGRLADEEVIAKLTQIKGIGRWTAEMFLIFSLGRLDVLPVDDLGIRAALKRLHGLRELPDKKLCHELAAPWRPYATIGSWYCWRSLDVNRNGIKAFDHPGGRAPLES